MAYCANCGKEQDNTAFCPHCGASTQHTAATSQVVAEPVVVNDKNGQAIAGLVLGIVAIVMVWIPFSGIFFGGITGILGIIFGALSRKSGRRTMALWGMWLGIVSLILCVIEIFVGIALFASLVNQSASTY